MSPENSKPEWFQMSEADGFGPKPRSKRAVRIMALATPLLVLGAGLVFAQTQDSPTAVASAVTSTAPATTAADPIAITNTTAPTAASTPITKPGIAQPGIAKPTGGGEDDGLERSSDDD